MKVPSAPLPSGTAAEAFFASKHIFTRADALKEHPRRLWLSMFVSALPKP